MTSAGAGATAVNAACGAGCSRRRDSCSASRGGTSFTLPGGDPGQGGVCRVTSRMVVVLPTYRPHQGRHRLHRGEAGMEPDNARELKARILSLLPVHPFSRRVDATERLPWVAVGLAPADGGRARVA